MKGRLEPDRLAAVDELLAAAAAGLDVLIDGFPYLLESHELSAAHQAVFDQLDSQFTPEQVQWMLAVAIGRASVRRHDAQREAGVPRRLRSGPNPASIWGRNAVEMPDVQAAHAALNASVSDAQQVLGQLADKTDEAVSEG